VVPGGVRSVFVEFYGCVVANSVASITLQPHSAVGAGYQDCAVNVDIYQDGVYFTTYNMRPCNTSGTPATTVPVNPGHVYTFAWYVYVYANGAGALSTGQNSPSVSTQTFPGLGIEFAARSGDYTDYNASGVRTTITEISLPQSPSDGAFVAFWLGVTDSAKNFIQVGEWTHVSGCQTKIQLFAQAYDTTGKQILNWAGPCGVTWSGAGQFTIYNSGLVSGKYRYLFSGPSGTLPTHVDTLAANTGSHYPGVSAELGCSGGCSSPSVNDRVGPVTASPASLTQHGPDPNNNPYYPPNQGYVQLEFGTTCPPMNVYALGANAAGIGSNTAQPCTTDGARLW
jgi:hypothetical protein